MGYRDNRSWKSRGDRATAVLIGGLAVFIIWTTLWPPSREAERWNAGPLARPGVAALPLSTLVLLLVVVLALFSIGRARPPR